MSHIPIFSIGYGSRQIQAFVDILQQNQIEFLIDVRSQPYSKHKPEFSKKPLQAKLDEHGIRYVFLGDKLGGRPEDPACFTDGKVDYLKLAQTAAYHAGIERLRTAHEKQLRVAIMCSEERPENCHRTHLIGKTLTDQNIPITHIDENGRLISQADVLVRGDTVTDQPPLFEKFESPDLMADVSDPDFMMQDLWDDMPAPPAPPDFDELPLDLSELAGLEMGAAESAHPEDIALIEMMVEPLPQFDDAQTALKQVFGFDSFRPMQADVIDTILAGGDCLTIMPTGSGKSLCYQLPALIFPGVTIVVSPLISLMEDQVMQLRELGIPAAYLNSTLTRQLYSWTMAQVLGGQIKLLYAAPETLVRPDVMRMLENANVSCLTIDEAHCISEWGHDFRPEYRQLSDIRRRLPKAVCAAVTATATERVREDIMRSLGIPADNEFVTSFNRENLFLAVEPKTDVIGQTLRFLDAHKDESGIVYCATRKQVETITAALQMNGWNALPYHAGLGDGVRQNHQTLFVRDDVPIIVATIAFGMGINKSNVRFVLHVDLPKNLESYYQQIGRAGRDGLRSECLLLYSYSDVQTINYFIQQQAQSQQIGARRRLQAMLSFVEARNCRRQPLLAYFDEQYTKENCGLCDSCTQEAVDLVDLTVPAQKFFSCIKRTGQMFGTNHIIDVLRGSRSQKVLGRGHDRLSTYNIGGEFSKKEWQYLCRQFIQQGYIEQDVEHGSLILTEEAYEVFQGAKVEGTLMPAEKRAAAAVQALPHDGQLFGLLRAKRKQLADAENIPPYIVFSDRALVEMATYFPHSEASFNTMAGVGAVKLQKYADDFLPIIRRYCEQNQIEEKPKRGGATPSAAPRRPASGGRMFEVITRFNEGQSLEEIAVLYGSQVKTVVNHLWKGHLDGHALRQADLAADVEQDNATKLRAMDAFASHGPDRLRPIFDALRGMVSYDDLHVLRLHYVLNKA